MASILHEYTKIVRSLSDCGISFSVFDSITEEDGNRIVFPVNPLSPLNSRVILKLYCNGQEIGTCTGELSNIGAEYIFSDLSDPEAVAAISLAKKTKHKRKRNDPKEIRSFVIYWITIDSTHTGKNLGILLLHLMMLNVCLRIEESYGLQSFHLEDDSDRAGQGRGKNMYDNSLFIPYIGHTENEPEKFLLVSRLMNNLIHVDSGIEPLPHRVDEYIKKLVDTTTQQHPLPGVMSAMNAVEAEAMSEPIQEPVSIPKLRSRKKINYSEKSKSRRK